MIREKSDYHNKSRSQIQQIPFRNGENSSAGGYRSNAADQQEIQTIPQARAPVVPQPNRSCHVPPSRHLPNLVNSMHGAASNVQTVGPSFYQPHQQQQPFFPQQTSFHQFPAYSLSQNSYGGQLNPHQISPSTSQSMSQPPPPGTEAIESPSSQ